MKKLPRWILGRFLGALAVFQLVLLALFTAVELFELREHYGTDPASLAALGEYLAHRAPFLAYLSMPVALVLAVIFVIAGRAQASELIAAQAGGIPLLRLTAPVLVAATFLGALLLAGAEFRVPEWSDHADYVRRVVIQKKHAPRTEYRDIAFLHEGRYVVADRFEPALGLMESVTVIVPIEDQSSVEIAGSWPILHFENDAWRTGPFDSSHVVLENVAVASSESGAFQSETSVLAEASDSHSSEIATLAALPSPRYIEILAPLGGVRVLSDKPIEALSVSTLWRESRDIAGLSRLHTGDARLRGEVTERLVKIQAKLALPLSVPLLALISICLGARVGRRQGMGAAIGNALMVSLGFMLVLQTATNMGTFAARSAVLQSVAPWFPWITPALLAVAAIALVRRSRFAN